MSNPPTFPVTPSPVTSSLVAPIPVPTHGPGGSFSVHAKTTIAAPPLAVLNAVRNTNTWKDWNSFCPRCTFSPSAQSTKINKNEGGEDKDTARNGNGENGGEMWDGRDGWLEIGSVVNIDVYMSGDGLVEGRKRSREQGLTISHLSPITSRDSESEGRNGYRIAWTSSGWSHWQLHSERVMDFLETEDGGTEYVCWETFGGVLGAIVKSTVGGTLVERFGDYAGDLKRFCEGKGNGEVLGMDE